SDFPVVFPLFSIFTLRACLNFTRLGLGVSFEDVFLFFVRMIANYPMSENGKKTGRKHKRSDNIFLLENLA
uniref:hypothetical protein n=1 Tax=Coprobacter sp. TaxID=1941478 RepID=UPI003AB82834